MTQNYPSRKQTKEQETLSGYSRFYWKYMKERRTMPHINEVQITFIKPKDGLIGFASFVLDDDLYLSGIGIHSKLDGTGYRLTYPTRKAGNGQASIFHPINRQIAKEIEQAVFRKLNDVMKKSNVRYSGFNDGQHAISN